MKQTALPIWSAISLAPFFRIDVAVGHLQRFGVADIDLFLPRSPLALRILDRDAGHAHVVAQPAHISLFLGGDADQIVADMRRGGVEPAPMLLRGRCRRSRRTGRIRVPRRSRPGSPAARRRRSCLRRMARGECGRSSWPWCTSTSQITSAVFSSHGTQPQRRQVGLHDEVAIALRPAGRLVAGHRLHIDVVGQQVVAGMGFFVAGSTKKLARKRLPISRPCMSTAQTSTVSISSAATAFFS